MSTHAGYEQVIDVHVLGRLNENKELFADFCAQNSLVIGDNVFEQTRIHKATWRSPDHVTENQIDHVQVVSTGCESKMRSRCSIRPSYGFGHTQATPDVLQTTH